MSRIIIQYLALEILRNRGVEWEEVDESVKDDRIKGQKILIENQKVQLIDQAEQLEIQQDILNRYQKNSSQGNSFKNISGGDFVFDVITSDSAKTTGKLITKMSKEKRAMGLELVEVIQNTSTVRKELCIITTLIYK